MKMNYEGDIDGNRQYVYGNVNVYMQNDQCVGINNALKVGLNAASA